MAAFCGKWVSTDVSGMKEFFDAIHTTDEFRAYLREMVPELKTCPGIYFEEVSYDKAANKFHRKCTIKGEVKKDVDVPVGVEHETTSMDGRQVKIKVHFDSDTKVCFHEKGDGFEFNSTLEIVGGEMVSTSKCGSVAFVMKFKKN